MFSQDGVVFYLKPRSTRWPHVIADHLGLSVSDLRFGLGPHGKPYLLDHSLFFNVSHTRDLMLVGISDSSEIGVDIEYVHRPPAKSLSIVKRFFTSAEYDDFLRVPEAKRFYVFLEMWCQKEAVSKCLGLPIISTLGKTFSDQVYVNSLLGLPLGYIGAVAVKRAAVDS